MVRIGVDVDGVLADFNREFIERVKTVTGRDLFPAGYVPTTWNYPESLGYTAEEVETVWAGIKRDPFFWQMLPPYRTTYGDLRYLHERILLGDDVYFITARPGLRAKEQTEIWLCTFWPSRQVPTVTVLISSHKGLCAQALGLDCYIDDRWENAIAASNAHWHKQMPSCRTFLFDRPWNRRCPGDTPELGDVDTAPLYALTRVARVQGIAEFTVASRVPSDRLNETASAA